MLQYFQPLTDNGTVVSIDSVVLDYKLQNPAVRDALIPLLEMLDLENHVQLNHWQSFKIGSYREQFTVRFADGSSFWIGVSLNLVKTAWLRVRLDFNPNKVACHRCFRDLLRFFNASTNEMHTGVKRFDLAIDIPAPREDVFLVKDARLYSERRHGVEYTQYLGQKSHTGHVKLYNKQAEGKLTYPLSRLELTIDPDDKYEAVNWPTVYFISRRQITLDETKLNETDRFILNNILLGNGKLTDLGRRTREKIERVMNEYVERVTVSRKSYAAILNQLRAYKKYPLLPLGDEQDVISDANDYPAQDGFVAVRDIEVFTDGE